MLSPPQPPFYLQPGHCLCLPPALQRNCPHPSHGLPSHSGIRSHLTFSAQGHNSLPQLSPVTLALSISPSPLDRSPVQRMCFGAPLILKTSLNIASPFGITLFLHSFMAHPFEKVCMCAVSDPPFFILS